MNSSFVFDYVCIALFKIVTIAFSHNNIYFIQIENPRFANISTTIDESVRIHAASGIMSCSTFKRAIRLICGANNNNNENNTSENKPGGGSVASSSFARSTPVVVFLPNTRRVRRQCWPFVTRRFRQTKFIISGRPRFCP